MNSCVILLCGGSGVRMGASQNKTFLPLGGVPALVRCMRVFASCCPHTVLVARKEDLPLLPPLLARYHVAADALVPGGVTRQASVRAGLACVPADCDTVLIHDGARGLIDEATVRAVLRGAAEYGAAVPAVPVKDTVKYAAPDGRVLSTPPRDGLYAVQTPQGFRKELLVEAHRAARDDKTDDAGLVEAIGVPVHLVAGSERNFKLTTPEDYRMAQALFSSLPRTGTGFDAHRLVEGRPLVLGGVNIPFEKGLLGHSDADVALHALTDALLGAAALGDIGKLFPDTDERYRDISSLLLLQRAFARLKEKGYRVGNCDVTIVAQRPKLAPYLDAMRQNIAAALETDVDNVSVKATTTEKMGYEGDGTGISAQAAALIVPAAPF